MTNKEAIDKLAREVIDGFCVDAIIRVKIPKWQIGEEVSIYFPDTMMIRGKCEAMPYPFYAEAYQTGYEEGKNEGQQCEKCDFRKFTETFIDGIVDLMNKNGITSVEQLSEILKGGAV